MLERIVTQQVFFYFVGAVIAIGVLAKIIAGISLKRLVKAASNMGKSNHALMKLVRAKFEHACMISDKVQNVRAFVDKYVYEYKVLGLRLHSWRQLERTAIWLCGLLSPAGAGMVYYVKGPDTIMYQYMILGSVGMLALFLLHITSDERYQLEAAKTYMVDFLENTYAHRYTKGPRKEFQVTVQRAMEERENVPPQREPISDPGNMPGQMPRQPIPGGEPRPQPVPVVDPQPAPYVTPQPQQVPVTEPQAYTMTGQQSPNASEENAEKGKKGKAPFGHGLKKKKEKAETVAASGNAYAAENYPQPESQNTRYDYEQYGMQSMRREYMPEQERGYAKAPVTNETGELEKEARIREILEEFLA